MRYRNKNISSQITAFGRPLCRSSTGECHLIGYLVCTNTLCSIIRSLYAAVSVYDQHNRSANPFCDWPGRTCKGHLWARQGSKLFHYSTLAPTDHNIVVQETRCWINRWWKGSGGTSGKRSRQGQQNRLEYLDLSTPVEESTIRKVNKNRQLRRRTRRISQTSGPTSPSSWL